MHPPSRAERIAILATLALIAANLALTARWEAVPGALRGWRLPYLAAALALTALATLWPGQHGRCPRWLPPLLLAAGPALLAGLFLVVWFPPASWTLVPFLDDWPPRFLSTVQGVALLREGRFVGWEWNLLGGYSTAADITQNLSVIGALPMMLLGDAPGFHLLHLVLFLAVPALVFLDLRQSDPPPVAAAAAGLVALWTCGLSWWAVRSGDTNSLAGLVAVLTVLVASQRSRAGGMGGFATLVLALTFAAFSHIGFFLYSGGLLLLEALYYRDRRHLRQSLAAGAVALVVSLPLTFELFRYPSQFQFNNVLYEPPRDIDWPRLVRKVGYNVQMLGQPGRWFNDPGGLIYLFAPLVLLAAWRREGRAGFYAWGAIYAVALLWFNLPETGYLFARPVHLLVAFTPVAVGWFVATRVTGAGPAIGLTLVAALCVQIIWIRVPHVTSVEAFVPGLVARLQSRPGALVLVENNPHRDVDASPDRTSERTLYGTHFEALLPGATGKRLYAGYWDGWQWTPFRGEMLAGGAWMGRTLTAADGPAFVAELQRWGIRHLFVWSRPAISALSQWPEFERRWEEGPWREFELVGAPVDPRPVVSDRGRADLVSHDPRGAVIRVGDARQGDRLIVRTHYHPAWEAFAGGRRVETREMNGQLALTAPESGSYDIALVYPARRWLLVLSFITLAVVIVWPRVQSSMRRATGLAQRMPADARPASASRSTSADSRS